MSVPASFVSQWPEGIAAACERLVHPSVADAGERLRQRRLLGVMLLAPFFAAIAAVQTLSWQMDPTVALAAICAFFGVAWLLAFWVVVSARRAVGQAAALAGGTLAVSVLIASAGGVISPLGMMAAALIVESLWVGGTRKAAVAGCAAALTAIASSLVLEKLVFTGAAASSSPWHWLVPALYAATLWTRFLHNHEAAEEAIARDTEARSIEEAMDAVVVHMHANGEVTRASAQASALLGLPPDILLGTGLFDRIHVADRVGYLCALADLREGAPLRKLRLRLRMPAEADAPPPYIRFSVELLRCEADDFAVIVRSDSECAGLEDSLDKAKQEAARAEKSKSHFAAAMSHELRTPLSAILGFSDMLTHEMFGPFADERQRQYVGLIQDAGNHLLSVVDTLLDVSKTELGVYSLRPEPFSFEEGARLAIALTSQRAADKAVTLTSVVAENVGTVICDRRALQQVLINLVSNAVKFTPAGGKVALSAQRQGDRLTIEVSDTGIGMAPHELARVGKPFVRVDNDYTRQCEGSGLGLALVRNLVGLLGGDMAIDTAPDAGTRVSISIPAAPGDAGRHGAAFPDDDEWSHETLRKTA